MIISICALPISAEEFVPADEYYRGRNQTKTVWTVQNDLGKYERYRLPGLVVTEKNTLILYGEARTGREQDGRGSTDDHCEMDLYIRRSTDGGETFGNPIYIAKGADYRERGFGETINNPVMISAYDGTLHLLFSCNVGEGGVWYTKSTDDGLTWSTPRDLSVQLGRGKNYTQLACGPGHGVCLENGRLVVPVWINFNAYDVYTVYSDDAGKTWEFGKKVGTNTDETTIAVLSDGSVMCNSRNKPNRMVSVSSNGTSRWSASAADNVLIDPACAGGLTQVDLKGLPYALLFVNCADTVSRKNVTLRCSFDDGKTWEKSLQLDTARGGYCEVAIDKNGKGYVVYETNLGETLELVSFSFYDRFCEGNEAAEATDTSFAEQLFDMAGNEEKAVLNNKGGAVEIAANAANASVDFDFTKVTRNINLSKLPFVAIKLSATGSNTDATLNVRFATGRNDFGETGISRTVKADGQQRVILLDTTENFAGTLQMLGLEFAEAGSVWTVEAVEFFADADSAYLKYPDADDGTSEQESTQTESVSAKPQKSEDSEKTEEKSGCGSFVSTYTFALVLVCGTGAAVSKKRGKN